LHPKVSNPTFTQLDSTMLSRAACACSGFGHTARFRRLATTTPRSIFPLLQSSKFLSTTTTTRIPVHAWQHTNLPLLIQQGFLPCSSSRCGEGGFLLQQQRMFSSRRRNDQNKKNESGALANEHLIKVLMKKNPNATAKDLMVRLVIDEGHESPATVDVVSLADAIQISVDRMTDLIGTSLDSDPPVIRVTQLSKLEYKKEQSKQKKPTNQKKAFRFRAGIDLHDLERKVKNLIKFLEQGLECDYSVFSKARLLRVNANAGMELVERIQELVSEYGDLKRPPQTSEQGNYIRVQLEPKKG
jgi:translation initiation factor IF-3